MNKLENGTVNRNSKEAEGRFIKGFAGGRERSVDLANRTVEGIASTISLDRDGEVILPSAFKARLGIFTGGNSPFVDAHQHRGPGPTQIGWVLEVTVARTDIRCKFLFDESPDPSDPANRWWSRASNPKGKGIAFSIGFIPIRWIYGSAAELISQFSELKTPLAAAGLKAEDKLRVYTEIELLEISAVAVGCNREALQILAAKWFAQGGEQSEELKQLRAELEETVKAQLAAAGLDKSAIENLKSEMVQSLDTAVAEIRDKVSQVLEAIELSSDTLGQAHPPAKDAPAGGETPDDRGESQGALRQAARDLLDTCET